jgi:transcriptional regulator with XRE-family HTH domain
LLWYNKRVVRATPKEKKMKSTIYDVASLSGVSIATVSRVVNGTANVRPATAFKVVKAIDDLNFIPDVNAVKLAKMLAEYRAERVRNRKA